MLSLSSHQVINLLATYGYLVVLLVVAVESTGIPLPGESILMIASIYAGATHHLHLTLVILAAGTGAVLGDNLGYLAGRKGGYALLQRFGPYLRLHESRLRLGRYLFLRHGGKVVFLGRFVAVLRIWAAFLAGANQMPWKRFLLFNAAGGYGWATVMGLLAYGLGNSILRLGGVFSIISGCLAMVLMGLIFVVLRRNERRLQAQADTEFLVERELAA